ncbi:MAG: exonuclease, partial [Phaeodactylibacter sp.]|nr:exonuclease [Phaeodactylibacter sp.]
MPNEKQKRTLLIDGDILAYQTALKIEKAVPWDEDGNEWTYHFNAPQGYIQMEEALATLQEELEADAIVVCLTDPKPDRNFRKSFMPTYKEARKLTRKPMALACLRTYLEENYKTYIRESLEADDLMGILATSKKIIQGEKIIVSIDKDMLTIPAKVFSQNTYKKLKRSKSSTTYEDAIVDVTQEEADRFHLLQTLTGDVTDGYDGCPSVGKKRAEEILDSPTVQVRYEHEFTRGKRKGETETRWKDGEECSTWEAVVSHYEKNGLTEQDALDNARAARISR